MAAVMWALSSRSLLGAKAGAPEISQEPLAPRSGEVVHITASVPINVTNLLLQYQLVDPGRYVELRNPSYQLNWVAVSMKSVSKSTDQVLFTAAMSAQLQAHRRLVRYRLIAQDTTGRQTRIPGTNTTVRNFAYFVYDGVPAWSGAINPRSPNPTLRAVITFGTNVMRRVQSYILIATQQSTENVTWREQLHGSQYIYTGTLVIDGVVYDHVPMRARGGVWRYMYGKNMWKFNFTKDQRLHARDDYGQPYPVAWDKLNLRGPIQQNDYGHRGEEGMFETVGFRLFNLAGVPAPWTHWVQLRIVSGADESPADQYRGDYWGLYLAIEDMDARFLKAHSLPEGNLYKMEWDGNNAGTPSHQLANSNGSDLNQFLASYSNQRPSVDWWRTHLHLPEYYSYRAICEGIHHYDIDSSKNYYYFHNPQDDRWQVFPWDLDLTWADNMCGNGEEPFKQQVLTKTVFLTEYRNRLREIRDLLFNPEEAGRLIDECAAIIADPAGGPSPVDADRAKWDYHPRMAQSPKGGLGYFYQIVPTKDFKGMVQLMNNYVRKRSVWIDTYLLNDPHIPSTPTLTYVGPTGFPSNQLSFQSSAYKGTQPFAAIQWRMAEISLPQMAQGCPLTPGKYEITAIWDSGSLTNQTTTMVVPAQAITGGHTYRVRVRMKDVAGSWSHWSSPVQFVAAGENP